MSPGDLQQLEDDVAQLLGAAGLPRAVSEKSAGFSLRRHRRGVDVRWSVDPAFDELTIGQDDDHPVVRFELDVWNAMVSAFAEILVKAGYAVRMRMPNAEDRDFELTVLAGPNQADGR